jgi:hypothetical protein
MKYIDNRTENHQWRDEHQDYIDDMTEQEYEDERARYEQLMEDEAVANHEFETSIWNNP